MVAATRQLLAVGRNRDAWAACQGLTRLANAPEERLSPLAFSVAAALRDEMLMREIFATVVRLPALASHQLAAWAQAFESAGRADWACEIYQATIDQGEARSRPSGDPARGLVRLLLRQQRFEEAESLLLRSYHLYLADCGDLLVQLYRDWHPTGSAAALLSKYALPVGVERSVVARLTTAK
jgi:hypothetical protein